MLVENKEKVEKVVKRIVVTIPVLLVSALLSFGVWVWKEYRNTLLENQKQQLLIAVKALASNLSVSLAEYEQELDFLYLEKVQQNEPEKLIKEYLETENIFICDVCTQKDGTIDSTLGLDMNEEIQLNDWENGKSIWLWSDGKGGKYIVFKRICEDESYICLVLDEEKYYQALISDIHVGTNGYMVIKTSQGIVVMHPDSQQWGIDVIEGRRRLYPQLDYTSLEEMIAQQKVGKEGTAEYYSYWWTNPDLPEVKKVSAYAPAHINDDYWIISAVIDYADFYEPIRDGMGKLIFVAVSILFVFVLVAVLGYRLLLEHKKSTLEIGYLKEMNGLLEELHRNEEMVAHKQRLEIMGTLTGGIAHEFNNFLTPIMGYSELLMMEFDEGTDEYENAKEILDAAEKAKDVIRQLSSMSRKNVETVYKNIEAKKMIKRVTRMIESILPAQILLKTDIVLGDEVILGNTTQLNQVILNICINAVHAIGRKNGEIQLRCRVSERKKLPSDVREKLSELWERYLCIEIEDNGCGMSQETMRNIFEPFFTTKGNEGTGLGLALAEQIVVSHKGHIYVRSEVGRGSTFYILLPVSERTEEKLYSQKTDKKEIRFLIADDNAKVLELLERNLKKLDLNIVTRTKREEVKAYLQEQAVDVLVIENRMEGGSGIEFCMSIQGMYPDMCMIVMTDTVTREILEAKQKKIINNYVEKPVSDVTLMEALRSCRSENWI